MVFLLIKSRLVIQSSRKKYKVYTWGGCRTEDNSPALKLEDACLLFLFLPEESAAATRSDQEVNKWPGLHLLLGPPFDITVELAKRALNWRSPKTEAGRSAPQGRARHRGKQGHHVRLQREPLYFPSLPSDPMFSPSLGSTSVSIPNLAISQFPLQGH